MATDVWWASKK